MDVFPIVLLFYPGLQHICMALPTFREASSNPCNLLKLVYGNNQKYPFLISKPTKFNYYTIYYFLIVIIPKILQQLVQRVYSGSWLQRDRSSSWYGGVAQVSVMASEVGSSDLTFSAVSMKERKQTRSDMRHSTLKAHPFPTHTISFLHQGHSSCL